MSLEINDHKVAQTDLSIPPSGSGKVAFNYTPVEAGFLYGNIAIDDDDLLPDNRSHFAMRIPSGSKIALISDDDQEAYFISNALAPSESENLAKNVTILRCPSGKYGKPSRIRCRNRESQGAFAAGVWYRH